MLTLDVPEFGSLRLAHLVLDYNGTLAVDGELIGGVAERLRRLAGDLEVHVVTADTFGKAQGRLASVPCRLTVLEAMSQAEAKRAYVKRLGCKHTAAIGNGRNDRLMLQEALIGILLVQSEGAAVHSLQAADIICRDARDALALLLEPRRIVATLRD